MQTGSRSTMGVCIDLTVVAVVTLAVQWLFYGVHVTTERVVLFTVLAVMLDAICGYGSLWLLRMFVPRSQTRPRRDAVLITVSTALLRMYALYICQVLIYGAAATPMRAGGLTLALYGLAKLRQIWQESTLEVSLDFTISILVNLVGQRLIYGALASAAAMTTFTIVFLPLVYFRRLGTRLLFAAMVPLGQGQSRWHSVLEIVCDTLLALLIAYGLQVIWYGAAATVTRAGSLTVVLYTFTMLRRYVLRRLFETWKMHQGVRSRPLG
jgi:hypothetical protein